MQMKQVVLALAATGVLSSQALAVEGWDAESTAVQPVQVALAGPATALPEQVALVEQEPAAQVAELAAKLPAVLPELPAALAVAEPAPFSAADMQALFVPSTEPLRLAVLSAREMEETQGAVIPLVALGKAAAVTGGWMGAGAGISWGGQRLAAHRGGTQWTRQHSIRALGAGAIAGLHASPAGRAAFSRVFAGERANQVRFLSTGVAAGAWHVGWTPRR